jgi:hypothetical protein
MSNGYGLPTVDAITIVSSMTKAGCISMNEAREALSAALAGDSSAVIIPADVSVKVVRRARREYLVKCPICGGPNNGENPEKCDYCGTWLR